MYGYMYRMSESTIIPSKRRGKYCLDSFYIII